MDRYCNSLRKLGKPAISINVGAIGGTGMIHNNYQLSKTMLSNQFSFIHYNILFNNLLQVISNNSKNYSQICISNQNWNKFSEIYPKVSIISHFKKEENNNFIKNNFGNIKVDIIKYIQKLIECNEIKTNVTLTSYGIDSIMSLQLSNWFKENYSFNISQLQILQGITIDEILNKFTKTDIKIHVSENNSKIKIFTKKIDTFNIEKVENIVILEDNNESNDDFYIISFLIICFLVCYWSIFY